MKTKSNIILKILATILYATIFLCTKITFAEELNKNDTEKMIQTTKDVAGDSRGRVAVELIKSDRSVTVSDLKELSRRSTAIIIGRPLAVANKSRYNEKTDEVRTSRLIHVQTVLKGSIENGSSIFLETPDGTYVRRDGVVGLRRASDARPVREGVSYFIFLRESNGEKKNVYRPSLGVQGIFEIEPETNTILPCDLVKSDPVVKKYENASVEDFMNELVAALSMELPRRR